LRRRAVLEAHVEKRKLERDHAKGKQAQQALSVRWQAWFRRTNKNADSVQDGLDEQSDFEAFPEPEEYPQDIGDDENPADV
jgi:hypothetical protein